jgi:hypothetical protein
MADKFTELFEEARNSGLPDDWVDRFQTTFEASGLRKDNLSIKEENRLLREQKQSLQAGLLRDRFSKLGITINPDYIKVPDDLDPANEEGVQEWAVKAGLITQQETTPSAERATHDRIAAASNEGNVTSIPSISDMQNLGEDEFWKVAQQREAAIKAGKLTP